jgi:Domain of unknown function (DUF1707)
MTGELSPSGQPGDNRPGLRVSHEDRDRVVEALRIAAGDGRLTAEELDERLELALTARTAADLAALTTDLPLPAGQPAAVPREVLRIAHVGGSARQQGHWVVPKRIEIDVAGGNVLLDFTHAVITGPVLPVSVRIRGGHLRIITRPGVEVDAADVSLLGGNVHVHGASGTEPALRVELSGQVHGGSIRALRPRKSFLQWLRGLLGITDRADEPRELAGR